MACTIGVARRGQQRSLARIFQVLRVETARSPRARILAWCRFTDFCRRDRWVRRRLNGVQMVPRRLGSPNGFRAGRALAATPLVSPALDASSQGGSFGRARPVRRSRIRLDSSVVRARQHGTSLGHLGPGALDVRRGAVPVAGIKDGSSDVRPSSLSISTPTSLALSAGVAVESALVVGSSGSGLGCSSPG